MDRRQLMYGMAAVGLAGRLNLSDLLAAQSADPQTADPKTCRARQIYPPDRELDEPRGGVKMCVEETRSSDGSVTTRIKEYGPDGALLAFRDERDGRVFSSTADHGYTEVRDDQGHLVKVIYAPEKDQPSRESYYTYDSAGRMLTATQNWNSDRIEYRYSDGAMVSIHTFDPKTIEGTWNAGFGGSPWEGAAYAGFGVPTGGTVIVSYDKNCTGGELRVLTSDGQVVTHIVRKYDSDGRLVEEKPLQENIALLMLDRMTTEQKAQVTPALIEEINKAMTGGFFPATIYSYDAQGRLFQKLKRNMMSEETMTIRYNDYGDRIEVSRTFADNSTIPEKRKLPLQDDSISEHYSYQYDSHGNWIEKVSTFSSPPRGFTETTHRILTYY